MKYTTSLFCEFDKYAAESYCAVHDTAPELNIGDITKADEKSVPDFNTMFGGSPCQDFSIAGKQGGLHGHVKTAVIHITLLKSITQSEINARIAVQLRSRKHARLF